jgi:hypothetical protein
VRTQPTLTKTVTFEDKNVPILDALQMIAEGKTLFDHNYVDIAKAAIAEIKHLRSVAGAVSDGPDLAEIKQSGVGSFLPQSGE